MSVATLAMESLRWLPATLATRVENATCTTSSVDVAFEYGVGNVRLTVFVPDV